MNETQIGVVETFLKAVGANNALSGQISENPALLEPLFNAASGDLSQTEENKAMVLSLCTDMEASFFTIPGTQDVAISSVLIWQDSTELGQVHAAALMWAMGDDIVTQAEAAEACKVSVQGISEAVKKGRVRGYLDVSIETRRQGRIKVSLSECMGSVGEASRNNGRS